MAQRENLTVQPRTVFGKQLKKLRREGILPGNVYGKNFTSTAVQLPLKEFKKLYDKVGSTGLVDLEIDGKKHPVLIHNLAIDTMSHDPIHADFFIVNLKEKITSNVPIIAEGESPAVAEKKGVLLQLLNDAEIEALPSDLPEAIHVDITKLTEVDDQITIEQIEVPAGVTILNEASQGIFRIGELVTQEAVEQEEQDEEAAAAASEEGAETTGEKSEEATESQENPQE